MSNSPINKGWNVHAYSKTYNTFLGKQKNLLDSLKSPIDPNIFNKTLFEITERYKDQKIKNVLNKFKSRYNIAIKGYRDPDLHNLNVAFLLYVTWNKVKELNDNSIWELFHECLLDIGMTCLQGDSHRLLNIYSSLLS